MGSEKGWFEQGHWKRLCCFPLVGYNILLCSLEWIKRCWGKNWESVWPEPPMRSLWVDSELQIRAFQPPPIRASPSKYSNPPRMSSLELRGGRSFMWNKSRINTRPCMRRLTNPNKAGHHRVISQNRGGDKKWAISEIYFTNWNTARQDAHCGAEQPVIPPFFFVCVSTLPPLQLVGNLQFWLFHSVSPTFYQSAN